MVDHTDPFGVKHASQTNRVYRLAKVKRPGTVSRCPGMKGVYHRYIGDRNTSTPSQTLSLIGPATESRRTYRKLL